MKIEKSAFDYTYHGSEAAGSTVRGYYMFHNLDVFNTISVDGIVLQAVYQTGLSYLYGAHSCPDNALELSECGSSELLLMLNNVTLDELDDSETVDALLYVAESECPVVNSREKLKALYVALMGNSPDIADFIDSEIYTDDEADYVKTENGYLIPAALSCVTK